MQDEIENSNSENESEKPVQSDEEIVALARDRFNVAVEAEDHIRRAALEDTRFSVGAQWDDRDKAERHKDGRPCLVVNRIPQTVRQITNDARQNRPAIKVSPVDSFADVGTAKIRQGLIRHIEYSSNADVAYDRALAGAVRGGFGFFRIVSGYFDPLSFNQQLRILSVRNPHTCYLDPTHTEPDGSDANWGFAVEDVAKHAYKKMHPNSKLSSSDDWESLGNTVNEWVKKDTVRVADYYYKDWEEKTLCLLSNSETILEEKLPLPPAVLPDGLQVIATRQTMVPIVHHLKINGVEILERTIWPGSYIPIVPVIGEEIDIDGERILEGVVRHAKDPQRMYNYWKSAETETIALAPRAPWIGVEGQFEGHEAKWQTANRKNHAYLEYRPVSIGGQPAAPPQRNVFEPPVQAITQASMLAAEDIKATTGIYDAAMGANSNEKSGIAIQRRANQSQTSNFHFVDNLSRSIRHGGRILNEAIPVVYDAAQAVRILGENNQEEVVKINQAFEHNGEKKYYDMSVGKYDITVSSGPSFETRRQEAATMQADIIRSYPQLMQVAGDILLGNLDIPGATELAERFKKTLPPGLSDEKGKKPIPPEIQAKMAQMTQMIEQLTTDLNEKSKQIESKTLELESKERIEMAKLQAQIEIKLAELGSTESLALLRTEIDEIQNRMNLLKVNEPIDSDPNLEEQNFDPAGPEMGAQGFQQQPTGGISPGNSMEYP